MAIIKIITVKSKVKKDKFNNTIDELNLFHAGKSWFVIIIHYNSGYCKQGLKLQDKRIYSNDTDAVFVADWFTIELTKIKAIITKLLADGRIECKGDKNILHKFQIIV